MKQALLLLALANLLSGCVAVVAGAAGATIANPKGAGQTVTRAGEAIQKAAEPEGKSKDKNK